jgi:hypothetical protein
MVRAAWVLATLSAILLVADPIVAQPQPRPRHGGELVFLVPSDPPSYD